MLIGRLGSQAGGLWFLESAICSLVGETGLEARAGSLEGKTRDQGILGADFLNLDTIHPGPVHSLLAVRGRWPAEAVLGMAGC